MAIKAVPGRRGNYSDLVARYSRAFVNELDAYNRRLEQAGYRADVNISAPKASVNVDNDKIGRRGYLVIDTCGAEVLESGTRILPEPDGGADNWCIFSQSDEESDNKNNYPGAPSVKTFSLVGILSQGLTADEFVEQAYLMVLLRPVDDMGRQTYQSRLENGALTRRGVLRSLSASKEARTKKLNLIIVPKADEWVDRISGSGSSLVAVDHPSD